MKIIELQTIANQEFSVLLDDDRYQIAIKETNGCMAVDISRNNTRIISGLRVVAGTPLLPYQYQTTGNFLFLTENDELPFWDKFQTTQSLIYISPTELAGL